MNKPNRLQFFYKKGCLQVVIFVVIIFGILYSSVYLGEQILSLWDENPLSVLKTFFDFYTLDRVHSRY